MQNETIGMMKALGFHSTKDFAVEWRVLSEREKEELKEYCRLSISD